MTKETLSLDKLTCYLYGNMIENVETLQAKRKVANFYR